jgi:hypothetical protein
MSAILASKIPIEATQAKISEFFSFCGKIKDIEVVEKTEKTKTIKVTFEKASAISTALLLNGAEFEGSQIVVTEPESSGASKTAAESEEFNEALTNNSDIDQESKPKSTIIAELLANGYVLQSSLVEKAVQFDQQRGISDRFNQFISNLDNKYHLQEKNKQLVDQTNNLYEQANNQWDIQAHWNQGIRTFNSYLDKFKHDKYGSQVHDFYTNVAKDVKSVNDEALRLAELKKQQQQQEPTSQGINPVFPAINTITPDSTTVSAASVVPLETKEEKK